MTDFSINEMQEMQKSLQEKYKDKWTPLSPEMGKNQMLWMIGEIGEVIDIIKKHGGTKASTDVNIRKELVEELTDVLMFYNDVLLCYGITPDELKEAYTSKFHKNMNRWQVFCKHKKRDTYEVPGRHRELGETIFETAK